MSYTEIRWPVDCPGCGQPANVDGEGKLYIHANEDGEECPNSGEDYVQ